MLLACVAWSAVGASVRAAFSSPLFIVLMIWLGASTVLCAFERGRWAIGEFRATRGIPQGLLDSIGTRSAVGTVTGSTDDVRELLTGRLRAAGFRVRATPRAIEARKARYGLLGSPVFHVALALLFLLIGGGQLTRAEGQIGVPVGDAVPNMPGEYGLYDAGVLHGSRNEDLLVAVTAMPLVNVVDELDRGPSPHVQLIRDGAVVAEGDVYPNAPLRLGSLLVHYVDRGYVAVFSLIDEAGRSVDSERAFFDFDESKPFGLGSGSVLLAALGGQGSVEVLPARRASADAPPRVRVAIPSGQGAGSQDIEVGETVAVPGGQLRLESVGEYARLSVADDFSVYPMYVAFGLATVGISLAVLAPYRVAWVLLRPTDGDDVEIRVAARHQRRDPAFEDIVVALVVGTDESRGTARGDA